MTLSYHSEHVCVKHAQSGKLSFSNRFIVYVCTGENDAKTLRVDSNFFENEEKKLRFQTNTDTCGQGLLFFYELLIGPQSTFSECIVIFLKSDWSIVPPVTLVAL